MHVFQFPCEFWSFMTYLSFIMPYSCVDSTVLQLCEGIFFIMTPFFIHLFRTIKILVVERYLNQNISMAFEWGKKVSQCKYLLQNIWPYICSFCWWMVYEGTSWRSAHRINIDWTWLVVKDFKRVCYNYSLWYCHF